MTVELSPIIGLPLIAALLLANAAFVATEFALVTVRRSRIQRLADEGSVPAKIVGLALENLDYWVAASQLGITMASIALGWFGEPALAGLIEPPVAAVVGSFAPAIAHGVAIAIAFLLITGLHIVIGEFVPKTIALDHPEGTALKVARPIRLFVKMFSWAIWLLNATGNGLLRLFGMRLEPIEEDILRPEELAYSMESSATAGLISRREFELSRHLLHLSSLEARGLMVPRNEIVAIPWSATIDDVLRIFAREQFTRYPVYRDSIDDITGVVDAESVLLDHAAGHDDWRSRVRSIPVYPETVTADKVLATARQAAMPLVLLVDEYGGTAGIVGVYDIVAYLAGDLPEEQDTDEDRIHSAADGSQTVSGLMPVSQLEQYLRVELPTTEVASVGGMVTSLLQRIPSTGDTVHIDGWTVTVVEMDGHRVSRVLLEPTDESADQPVAPGERGEA